jgi:hypothetical protein
MTIDEFKKNICIIHKKIEREYEKLIKIIVKMMIKLSEI